MLGSCLGSLNSEMAARNKTETLEEEGAARTRPAKQLGEESSLNPRVSPAAVLRQRRWPMLNCRVLQRARLSCATPVVPFSKKRNSSGSPRLASS